MERYRDSELTAVPVSLFPRVFRTGHETMDVFALTRELIDIPSITPEEEHVGQYLYDYLSRLARDHNGRVERFEVEPKRWNVFVSFGTPAVTLSTHMDTVPPFVASREDDEFIWGRGACDTKGIIASMLTAA
ncbi:MAG TPA: M20/M25/M40 family metallo-hydrolase, partial [Bryobacteraceae bacterium]|nr:M20/M25/M40 family metallo-hydrolase [Bryobacteraceae bacterium]